MSAAKADITTEQLQAWAKILVDHSLGGVGPDDVVMIKGEPITWPLLSALQDRVIQGGARPDMWLVPPDNDRGKVWGGAMARHGSKEQIQRVPPWLLPRYEHMTKFIEVLGAEDPSLYAGLPRELDQAIMGVDEPYKTVRYQQRWAVTLLPTQGRAALDAPPLVG